MDVKVSVIGFNREIQVDHRRERMSEKATDYVVGGGRDVIYANRIIGRL
jgi:hypothetical protein